MQTDKYRSLLPLFIKQPLAMCALAAGLGVIFCALCGVAYSAYQVWYVQGFSPFLPSANSWKVFILAGIGAGIFNIALKSAEIDLRKGRKRDGPVTWSLIALSCGMFVGAVDHALMDTWLHVPMQENYGGLLTGIVFAAILNTMLLLHRKKLSAVTLT
jgi:H+/Cl- antiporter ClcA